MLTLDTLREFGADVDSGLARCMNNEGFYIMLVKKVIADKRLEQLEQQLKDKDLDAAFESAHTLKGMYANLSLTPITEPVNRDITNETWLARDTPAITSWFNLPSISASEAPTRAVRSLCRASGIAKASNSL